MTKQQDLHWSLPRFRRYAALLVLSLMAGVCGAHVVTVLTPPTYEASASMLVTNGPTTYDQLVRTSNAQNLMPTIARLAESRTVAEATARSIGLPTEAVIDRISADSVEGVQILRLTAQAATADEAAAIANGAAHALRSQAARMRHGDMDTLSAQLLDSATAPTDPAAPKPFLNALIGSLLGLLVGVGLARLRDLTDDKIRSAEELSAVTGAPVMASVPLDRAVRRQPLISHRPHGLWSEAFGHLRTNLEFTDVDSPPRLVAVTSSLPAEGKSIVACNLALSMARAGRRVLLIEADLRRPRCHEYLGLAGSTGLTGLLAEPTLLDEVAQPCSERNLTFLAAGVLPPSPGELLASSTCLKLLHELRERYDLVILDLPSMTFADAADVAGRADGTILVSRYRATSARQLGRTLQALTNVNARLVGCVLNMTPSQANDFYPNKYHRNAKVGAVGARAVLPAPSTSSERQTRHRSGNET